MQCASTEEGFWGIAETGLGRSVRREMGVLLFLVCGFREAVWFAAGIVLTCLMPGLLTCYISHGGLYGG